MNFIIFDNLVFLFITISTFLGAYKGAIKTVIDLVCFLSSILCAFMLHPYLEMLIKEHINNHLVAIGVCAVSSYVVSMILFTWLGSGVISLFSGVSHGFVDRILGMGIGLIRGLLIVVLIFGVIAILANNTIAKSKTVHEVIERISAKHYPEWLAKSITAPYLESMLKKVIRVLPTIRLNTSSGNINDVNDSDDTDNN